MRYENLAENGILIRSGEALQTARAIQIVVLDKTGTITMNQLAVTGVIPQGGAAEAEVLLAGALASREANQDPIDLAFISAEAGALLQDRGAFTLTNVSCMVHFLRP